MNRRADANLARRICGKEHAAGPHGLAIGMTFENRHAGLGAGNPVALETATCAVQGAPTEGKHRATTFMRIPRRA